MLNKQDLVALGKVLAKADASAPVAYEFQGKKFDYDTLNETFRRGLNEYVGTYALYRENKNIVFSIMEEIVDDVIPRRIQKTYESFAETRTFAQGDKPLFRRKINARTRAKQFITRVGLAGIYEVFKLGGSESFEVPTSAVGGAAQIGFEEFLDGMVDFGEVMDIVIEGIDDLIYKEVAQSLIASVNQLPAANRHAAAGFDEAAFDSLVNVASFYGEPVIYCTYEFAVKMVPQASWQYTDAMKEELWRTGRLATYKGRQVVILPQTVVDESNVGKVIDPGYCWIIPSGSNNEKPVKIAFEGGTIVDEYVNADRSREVQVYKKVGVVPMMTNNICCYIDTSLQGDLTNWHLNHTVQNTVTVLQP